MPTATHKHVCNSILAVSAGYQRTSGISQPVPEMDSFKKVSVLSLQCGSAAAAVPGQSSAEENQGPGSRRGHSSCGYGDRQPDPVHHPLSI